MINVKEEQKYLLKSPRLKEEINNKLNFVPKSIDNIGTRLFIYIHNERETNEILNPYCEFFKVSSRKNLDISGTSIILHNINLKEIEDHDEIHNHLENIGIVNIEAFNKENKNGLSVRGFLNSRESVRNFFIKHYLEGIKLKIGNEILHTAKTLMKQESYIRRQ